MLILGNNIVKYKVSAFCFSIGNIPVKNGLSLNDRNLLLLSASASVQKYGYKKILKPVLDIMIS